MTAKRSGREFRPLSKVFATHSRRPVRGTISPAEMLAPASRDASILRSAKPKGALESDPAAMFRSHFTDEQLEMFRRLLQGQRLQLMEEAGKTVKTMGDLAETFPDPSDRAAWENDSTRDLRIRDRERKLIDKIEETLKRIEDGTFGECEECGEVISIGRLKARPVTTLCIACKAEQEDAERKPNRS